MRGIASEGAAQVDGDAKIMRSVVLASPARSCVWSALCALVLVCGIATSSRAALTTNTITQGQLETVINVLDPIFDTLTAPISAGATRDGAAQLTHVTFGPSAFQTTGFVVPVTDPGAYPIAGIGATVANGTASFTRVNGKFGGSMPLVGVNKVCLFQTCSIAVANLSVPISVVGQGGTAAVTGAVNLTVIGAPWTQGTASIGTVTRMGNAGAATQMTISASNISNVISLVSPVFVSTNIAASAVVPVWSTLDFTLTSTAPEPGTLAAFGAAIVSLVAVGLRRRR